MRLPQWHSRDLRFIPLRRQIGRDGQRVIGSVPFQSEHAAHCRRKHHRGRPQLMRCAPAQPLVELSRQQLRDRAQVLRPGEICILHQMSVAREAAAVAIFGQRNPSREERPHTALVIANWIVEIHCGAEIARAPIRGELLRCPSIQHSARVRQFESAVPSRDRGIDLVGLESRVPSAFRLNA